MTFSDIQVVDFDSKAASDINNWCSEITKTNIKNVISPGDYDDALVLLISAIYFNGLWEYPFPPHDTFPQKFFLNCNDSISVFFMKQSGQFYYLESDELDAKILRLPYKVSFMYV